MPDFVGYLIGGAVFSFSLLIIYVNTPRWVWAGLIEDVKTQWREIVKGEDASSYKYDRD